ncbi:hypothetical protein [Miniimonas arenae]|uniref:hypothetical protein n=1 Tax=Miniimonas arenae TaxID=676201 RepID=UPI0028B05958|nr:hypothetical protein [Miniimonas arenae]
MLVITADQEGSRHGVDRVPEALDVLEGVPVLLPFVRTVGDELQGVPEDAAAALEACLRLVRLGGWSIGVGVGPGRLASTAPESAGEAFVRARAAVERAKGRTVPLPLAIEAAPSGGGVGPDADVARTADVAWTAGARGRAERGSAEGLAGREVPTGPAGAAAVEPLVHLLAAVVAARSDTAWRVLDLLATGTTGVEVARELRISPQAVSKHRRAALWDTEQAARPVVARLLAALDGR